MLISQIEKKRCMLEELLAVAVTLGRTPESLKDELQSKYLSLLEHDADNACALQQLTGMNLAISEEQAQNIYKKLANNSDANGIIALMQAAKIKPLPETTQHVYEQLTRMSAVNEIKRLRAATGIEPKVSDESAHEGFVYGAAHALWPENLAKAIRKELVFVPEKVQQAYEEMTRTGLPDMIVNLDTADIEPAVSQEAIDTGYLSCINRNKVYQANELCELTNRKPSAAAVQSAYDVLFRRERLDDMQEVKNATGIAPEIPENKVLERYNVYLEQRNEGNLEKLRRLTGIATNFTASQVDSAFEVAVVDTEKAIRLLRFIGLPSAVAVQKVYRQLIDNEDYENIMKVQEATGIKQSPKTISYMVQKMMSE